MCNPENQSATVTTEPTQDGIDHDSRSHAQRQHDAIGALLRGQLGDPKLGQHNGLPVTVIVSATLEQLQAGAGVAVTGGGTLLPMRDLIRMSSHAYNYLCVFEKNTQRPLYLVLRWRPPPVAAAFNEIVVVNQYNGFAHWPLRPDPAAILNALAGAWYRHAQTAYVDLAEVPTGNVTVETRANGTTATSYLMPAIHLPLTQPLRDIGVPAPYVDALDAALRPMIDTAYHPLPAATRLQRRDPAAHQDQRPASAHRGRTAGRAVATAAPRPERGHRAARSSVWP